MSSAKFASLVQSARSRKSTGSTAAAHGLTAQLISCRAVSKIAPCVTCFAYFLLLLFPLLPVKLPLSQPVGFTLCAFSSPSQWWEGGARELLGGSYCQVKPRHQLWELFWAWVFVLFWVFLQIAERKTCLVEGVQNFLPAIIRTPGVYKVLFVLWTSVASATASVTWPSKRC